MASEAEWAWLAGIVEGEGNFAWVGVNSVAIRVNMTDRDVVERCQRIAGGDLRGPIKREGVKDLWFWRVGAVEDVERVLDAIEPWLGERRGQRVLEARERLVRVRRPGHCKRGHPMSGDNLYESPRGQRLCRRCMRERDRKRDRSKRE